MGGRWDGSRLLLCSVYIIWLRQLCLCLCVYVSVWLYGCQYVNTSVLILTDVFPSVRIVCTRQYRRVENDHVCVKAIRSISIIVCECLFVCMCVCVKKCLRFGHKPLTGNETVEVTVLFKTNWLRKLCLCCQICHIRIFELQWFYSCLRKNQLHYNNAVALKIALWHRSEVVNANCKGSVTGLCKSDILV